MVIDFPVDVKLTIDAFKLYVRFSRSCDCDTHLVFLSRHWLTEYDRVSALFSDIKSLPGQCVILLYFNAIQQCQQHVYFTPWAGITVVVV